jgi:hypothetical protein
MTMLLEIGALELKFNPYPLPPLTGEPPGNTIGKPRFDFLHVHMQVFCNLAEKVDHSILIDRGIDQSTKIDQISYYGFLNHPDPLFSHGL